MPDAEKILILGHRGLLGRALLDALPAGAAGGRAELGLYAPEDELFAGRVQAPAAERKEGTDAGSRAATSLERITGLLRETPRAAPEVHDYFRLLAAQIAETAPDVVINCTGYTGVDKAEAEPEVALAVNAAGPELLAKACARAGSYLVHMSTDHVFDGKSRRPYRESDPTRPPSVYGAGKLLGEQRVQKALPGALVVRSAWFMGPGRACFVDKILAQAKTGRPFSVVRDQWGSPTYTVDLAGAVLGLASRRVGGIIHVVNQGKASRWELARQAVRLAGMDPELVLPIETKDIKTAAARPAYAVLEARRYARLTGQPLPTWLDALRRYLDRGRQLN